MNYILNIFQKTFLNDEKKFLTLLSFFFDEFFVHALYGLLKFLQIFRFMDK